MLRRVSATLAEVSLIAVAPGSAVGRRAGSLPREDLAAARRWLGAVAEKVPSELRHDFDRLSRELADTSDCESAPAGLVHSDCHVGNVVVSHRGPVLFGWEALAWDR
jgi:Ser/Thr protein kinase RdoA (MazF antagonist)